jgi:hypothetical protein
LEYFFERDPACEMQRDPCAGRSPNKKVSVSNIDTRIGHACNEADLPCARSVSASRENQGARDAPVDRPHAVSITLLSTEIFSNRLGY